MVTRPKTKAPKRHGNTVRRGSSAWWEARAHEASGERNALREALNESSAMHRAASLALDRARDERDAVARELAQLRAEVARETEERDKAAAAYFDKLAEVARERDDAKAALASLAHDVVALEVEAADARRRHSALRDEHRALAVALRVVGKNASYELRGAFSDAEPSVLPEVQARHVRHAEVMNLAMREAGQGPKGGDA